MKETSVCIVDFCGGMNHDLYGYVNSVSFCADYYPDRKTTVFGGLWSEIPDLITTHEPSEETVDNHVKRTVAPLSMHEYLAKKFTERV